MIPIDTRNPINTNSKASSKPLFALKPRQVLLAEHNRRITMTTSALEEEKNSTITSLTPEMKEILHQSIINYLHRNGFSKTLKRFQSEAQIQNDNWKDSSLNLEDIYHKYMNDCNSDSKSRTGKKSASGNDGSVEKERHLSITNEEATKKKKKKKDAVENESVAIKDKPKVTDNILAESGKNHGRTSEDIVVLESETKLKKKKKTKQESDSLGQTEEAKSDVVDPIALDIANKKHKNKKEKDTQKEKEEDTLELCTTKTEHVTNDAHKEKKNKKKKSGADSAVKEDQTCLVAENGVEADLSKKDKKSSKKRKRLPSDENEQPPSNEETIEESKRQKTEASEKEKNDGQLVNGHANGKLETNGGEKSGSQKSVRKERNDSAEPKTVNAFQRVKIDQVEFAHEKLQDNSYWAKDGADVGYGAKAQEVLGQVRGRDFRHEKTKKKRGSYRGGQIDLQSHSIKFNYSDEE